MAKKTTTVGLDIGTASVKLIELASDADATTLVSAQSIPVTDHASTVEAIKTLFPADNHHASRSVRIGVAGPSVLLRRLQLPIMTPQELKGAIRFEAESHIPFPIEECFMDFQILGQKLEEKMMSVLLVAAKRDFVNERIKLLDDAGIKPDIVDAEVIALTNAFKAFSGKNLHEMKTYGLLHIGHHASLAMIVQNGEPFFAREIAAGVESAEQAAAEAIAPVLDEFTSAVEFFENTAGEELKHVWLSGGGALVKDAAPFMTEQLGGRQVALWEVTKPIQSGEHADAAAAVKRTSEFAVAFGLALPRSTESSR